MVIDPLPFFDVKAREAVDYLACKGCAIHRMNRVDVLKHEPGWDNQGDAFEMDEWKWVGRDYTGPQLLEHFRDCEKAQELWNASVGGTVCTRSMENDFIWTGYPDVQHYDE